MQSYYKIKSDKFFSLEKTFNCGQCFRFDEVEPGCFRGVAQGRLLRIDQDTQSVYFYCDKDEYDEVWNDYFDLSRDYGKIAGDLSQKDECIREIMEYSAGIRILKQDPFEALISFIISQNNHIPRIKGIIQRLCENFGEEIRGSGGEYKFPRVEVLADVKKEELSCLRCGFRDEYILDAIHKVNCGEVDLEAIRCMDIAKAREELMKIKGVGPKVAECVLLYGLNNLEAFPMDVWMKRAMSELFPGRDPGLFGKYAGIAQQHIFHYSRLNKIKGNGVVGSGRKVAVKKVL